MLHHVAIVTSEYPPEPTVSGRMMRDMAVYLNERGCRVSIICPYPSRGVSSPENPGYVTNEKSDEALIIRVPSFFSPRSSFPLRIRESWSFGRWSVCALRNLSPPPDVVYSATWPMLGQAWITAAVAALKVPHLTHVMDLYPESALLKTSPLVRKLSGGLLLRLDRWNAIRADHLAVISESMRQAYLNRRGLRPEQVSVVHTWQDETPFHRLPDPAQAFAKYGVPPGAFTFQYLGNIGPVAGVEHLVTSFRDAELKRCQLVIAGQGSNREVCRRLAAGAGNIFFISDPKIENVPLMQSMANVFLLPVRRSAALSSIPSKLSSYMLSARPVLASVDADSDSARVVREAQCGWVIEPENREELVRHLRELSAISLESLALKGARGREYAMEHFSRSRGVERITALLKKVQDKAKPATQKPVAVDAEPA